MDYKKIGERIRNKRKELDLSADKVAETLEVGRSSIFRYENGDIGNMSTKKVKKLAEILQVSPAYLLGLEDSDAFFNSFSPFDYDEIQPVTTQKIPLLGEIACGTPIYAAEDKESYILAGTKIKADFCLKAKGDSMINARIHDGDIVFVRKQPAVDNGEIAVVLIDDEATLKRVYYYPEQERIILQAENPAYPPLIYSGKELDDVYILGKAIGFQSDIK